MTGDEMISLSSAFVIRSETIVERQLRRRSEDAGPLSTININQKKKNPAWCHLSVVEE